MHGMPATDKFLLIIKQENLVSHHVEWVFFEILSQTKRKKSWPLNIENTYIHSCFNCGTFVIFQEQNMKM